MDYSLWLPIIIALVVSFGFFGGANKKKKK